MKAYFITIMGAAVLSALASVMSPDKWRAYVRLITGIVIICCVMSPVAKLIGETDAFSVPETADVSDYDEDLNRRIVEEELTKRIEDDIEARMKREYGRSVKARAELNINENNEIEGVTRISISGALPQSAKRELCGIYGVDAVYEE